MKNNDKSQSWQKLTSKDAYEWWKKNSSLSPGDTWTTKLKKIFIKIMGILLIIIFSPLLLLALTVAFFAAL